MVCGSLGYNPAMRALLLFAVALPSLAYAQTESTGGKTAGATPEWPQFRGPNASGVAAPDARPPLEFGPSKQLALEAADAAGAFVTGGVGRSHLSHVVRPGIEK